MLEVCTDAEKFTFLNADHPKKKTQRSRGRDSLITLMRSTLLTFIPPNLVLLDCYMAEPFGSSDSVPQLERLCDLKLGRRVSALLNFGPVLHMP